MDFDIRYYESVVSTMDIASDAAIANAYEGLVIQAGEQQSGRGRRGNQWTSPKGNLYQTIVLKPKVARQDWGQLSFVIAVALAMAVLQADKFADIDLRLKWPNDVMINGKKLAGILIEAGADYVLIGTGVNLEHAPDDRARIQDFSRISLNSFRDIFLDAISTYYNLWQEKGFIPIRDLWMTFAFKKGQVITANLKNQSIRGVFQNIDNSGSLILRSSDGEEHVITSSEIINWGQ